MDSATAKEAYELALKEAKKDHFDPEEVISLLDEAIALGSPDAEYALATWYLHGTHVKRNQKKAVRMLKHAADEGCASAAADYAIAREKGVGSKKSEKAAFRYYLKSAFLGDEASGYEVGRCYHYGIGVKRDRKISEIWFARYPEVAD